jgi:hypothetical protein
VTRIVDVGWDLEVVVVLLNSGPTTSPAVPA